MVEYKYWDFKNNPITTEQYKLFLKEYYGCNADSRYERTMWYHERGNFRLLLALENGVPLGQSCAFQVDIYAKGNKEVLWWGVDAFVLPNERGKGIGKNLQKKLHKEIPNFSSLWYSNTNGIIKHKCGAIGLFRVPFNFYSVNSFFSVAVRAALKKFLNCEISFPKLGKHKYYTFNRFFSTSKDITIKEVFLSHKLDELLLLVQESMKMHDFYIVRDKNYIIWKYLKNPTIGGYKTLFFYSDPQMKILLGAVIFSAPYTRIVYSIPLKIITILDYFIVPKSTLTKRTIILSAMQYCANKKIQLDGVLALGNFSYTPVLRYPYKGNTLLSNYVKSSNFKNPYISYSDQDMEQMIFIKND